ncbi:hypothetical protein MBANPS3_005092 [Mucor bainieri]
MAYLLGFPQEILLWIFQYLSTTSTWSRHKTSLQQLQFVNKSWSKAAQRLLYEDIFLYRNERQAALYLQILESPRNKSVSHTVRKISFYEGEFHDGQDLRSLIKICPNIEVIAPLSYNCKFNYYSLSELRKEGYLQRLKKVTAPECYYKSLILGYEDAMLSLASTATELRKHTKSVAADGSAGSFPLVANHLSDFVSLKKLEIHDYEEHQMPLSEVAELFINNQPPQLNRFELILYSNRPSGDYAVNGTRRISQVEQATLQLEVISAQDLCYIMRMFPELKQLGIETFEHLTYLPEVNDTASKQVFHDFSKYVSRIPILKLQGWKMQPEVLLDSMSSLVKFNTFRSVNIELYHIGEVDEINLHVTRSAKQENICYGEDRAACYLNLALSFEATYHLILTKALLTNPGLESLEVIWYEGNLPEEDVEFGACLDYILSHCAALKELSLECLVIDPLSSDITTNQSDKLNLSSLTLKTCQVSMDGYGRMSQRIKHVDVFDVRERASNNDRFYYPRFEAVEINMPYTTFHKFIYANEWDTFAVKIRLCTKVVTFKVSKGETIERLTNSSPYICNFATTERNFHTLTVCCQEMSFFSVEGCGSPIKV